MTRVLLVTGARSLADDRDAKAPDAAAREAVAARYDRLAETCPIYAGMWRAMARILRRGTEHTARLARDAGLTVDAQTWGSR